MQLKAVDQVKVVVFQGVAESTGKNDDVVCCPGAIQDFAAVRFKIVCQSRCIDAPAFTMRIVIEYKNLV